MTIFCAILNQLKAFLTYIKSELAKQGLNVEIVVYNTKEKALKNMIQQEKKLFYKMSQKQEIFKDYVLGFEKAEALMAFYNNTPNDTLGLFWFMSKKNKPIFPRELEEKPGWKLSNEKKKRRSREQYESKCQ